MPFTETPTNVGMTNPSLRAVANPGAGLLGIAAIGRTSTLSVGSGTDVPWPADPASSWLYYDCTVGVMLDSGIVVHNRLPQVDRTRDTLAARLLEDADQRLETRVGVNLRCSDQYTDIVQRMGHARYWFRLWGRAMRVGYQVPIPGLKSVGGVLALPYDKNPQWAYNKLMPRGNYGGVLVWMAEWSLWYTTAVPTTSNALPAADPSALVPQVAENPAEIQLPTV